MPAKYPFGREISQIVCDDNAFEKGNFSLWYRKFVPVNQDLSVCDEQGNSKKYVNHYFGKYKKINFPSKLLVKKHNELENFCNYFASKFIYLKIKATTISPLVVGMGEMHPSETSMLFDRNLGIPYIPASSIKGVVRFAKTLEMVMDLIEKGKVYTKEKGKEFVNLEKSSDFKTLIDIFGGDRGKKKWRGRVIFLDAYPENEVELDLDIMNPHYGDYYSKKRINEQNNRIQPPSDNLTPNPIKFLVVKPQTTFIFRALIPKEYESLTGEVKKIFEKALEKEGIGAKTSLGYGRFKVENVSIN